jgi:gamma-carbonic anhydrase
MTDYSIIPFNGKTPIIHPTAFIAAGVRLIGDVEIGEGSSVWFNCVLRGDVNFIRVGKRSNIQDGTVVHCDGGQGGKPGYPTLIGDDVLIGHMAMIHGCTIEDHGFVGLGTIVMDGCVVEGDAMLAAGAMLTPGKRALSGQLWAGSPAKHLRDLSPEDIAGMRKGAPGYAMQAQRYLAEAIRA